MKFPFENYGSDIEDINLSIEESKQEKIKFATQNHPVIFWADFQLPPSSLPIPLDTFLDPKDWSKVDLI